jgi:hypothetical protein
MGDDREREAATMSGLMRAAAGRGEREEPRQELPEEPQRPSGDADAGKGEAIETVDVNALIRRAAGWL